MVYLTEIDVDGSFPHACGGVPLQLKREQRAEPFSPRMWGCTVAHHRNGVFGNVFPTHVGVYLHHSWDRVGKAGFPHACGGVPPLVGPDGETYKVFPTHVGVYLIIKCQ